jgi:hypothetical protein
MGKKVMLDAGFLMLDQAEARTMRYPASSIQHLVRFAEFCKKLAKIPTTPGLTF